MIVEIIAFWVIAIGMIGSALMVVFSKELIRALLWLVTVFILVALLFITLNAEFLAAIQILVMVGAIAVVILFGIMLTRRTIMETI